MAQIGPEASRRDPVRHVVASLAQENHQAHVPRVHSMVRRLGVRQPSQDLLNTHHKVFSRGQTGAISDGLFYTRFALCRRVTLGKHPLRDFAKRRSREGEERGRSDSNKNRPTSKIIFWRTKNTQWEVKNIYGISQPRGRGFVTPVPSILPLGEKRQNDKTTILRVNTHRSLSKVGIAAICEASPPARRATVPYRTLSYHTVPNHTVKRKPYYFSRERNSL